MKKLVMVLLFYGITFFVLQCNSKESSTVNYDVIIDAAHGGNDPGAIVRIDFPAEKDIVLQISRKIKSELKKEGIQTILTREDDRFVSFKDRTSIINKSKARIILSIHTNMSGDSAKNGYITLYQEAKTESMLLDKYIHQELNSRKILKDDGSQAGQYYILTETSIPSLIIFLGYMSNHSDYAKMTDKTHQSDMAKLIALAISKYVKS